MADVVLFHHALGLPPGIVAFADELRRAGHTVHTPELFAGRTFDTLAEGVAHAEEIGFGEVIQRGVYPGNQHYFADSTLPSYDPAAATLMTQRVLAFLATR